MEMGPKVAFVGTMRSGPTLGNRKKDIEFLKERLKWGSQSCMYLSVRLSGW